MSVAVIYSRAAIGITAPAVKVEAHIAGGLPRLSIVGLPETTVKESAERVRCAIINAGFDFPAGRITINLAPADLPKSGGRFDLAIALGILAASSQIPAQALENKEFLAELALSGELRPVPAALPAAIAAGQSGRSLILPETNAREAARVREATIFTATSLASLCTSLVQQTGLQGPGHVELPATQSADNDLADIKGQHIARRVLEIAAAGGHNLLFYGPPGTGKTMLASRLPQILPPLTDGEAREVAVVQSVAGLPNQWGMRPFRTPHHTASGVALVGGGSIPRPGEISLAHQGVLFLDELPEFNRKVLEVLREPLESGHIVIARAARSVTFPARFQLVAAMNPCPCGYTGHPRIACSDTPDQIRRYQRQISGPLLDRIDLQVEVPAMDLRDLRESPPSESSETVRERVIRARQLQFQRSGCANHQLSARTMESVCRIKPADELLLERAAHRFGLSLRACHRILRVARTIADLDEKPRIASHHLTEALGYRGLNPAPPGKGAPTR